MNDLIYLIQFFFQSKFHDLVAGLCGIIVVLSAYYWFDNRLSGRIRSVFLRRTTIAVVTLILFFIYFLIWENNLRHYFIMAICSFLCFTLYYLLTYKLFNRHQRWGSTVKVLITFLMFWLFLVILHPIGNFIENTSRSFEEIMIGNYHLSQKTRISSFKMYFLFNITVALMATSVDVGCRFVLGLQQVKKKAKELETLKLKEQLTKAQLDALHAKINPHFLYNALNSIAGLALTDGQKTRKMAIALSKFFRYSINQEQSNMITLREEMAMLETYLEIEKVRFEERLNYEITIQPETEHINIPRFILQPLVENSVKHGLKGDKQQLFIRIQSQRDGKNLSLSVQDNGLPFADNFEPGYGLKSVYDKLDLLFPEKYEVALFNTPVKQVRILIGTES